MVERDAPWPPGTPTWVDLASNDAEAATAFYAGLFGWDCKHQGSPDYFVCSVGGEDVAGIGPKQPGIEHLPSRWTTYLATDQLESTIDTVLAEGGDRLLEPREIAPHGRMAIAADPNGAIFGLWQAADHVGTERRHEPGMLVWSEALSNDYETARAFYTSVFDYRHEELFGDTQYAALFAGDRPVAGTGEFHPTMPDEISPHWLPYFATTSTDGTVEQVRSGGGDLVGDPLDTDFGRMAVLTDPEHALFAIIQLG